MHDASRNRVVPAAVFLPHRTHCVNRAFAFGLLACAAGMALSIVSPVAATAQGHSSPTTMPTSNGPENPPAPAAARSEIEEAEAGVRQATPGTVEWAKAMKDLGMAWKYHGPGEPDDFRKAIECFEAALPVLTNEAHPRDWAGIQFALGHSWMNLPNGDRAQNVPKSIAHYEAALTVYTQDAYPDRWSRTQMNLGVAWRNLPTGDRIQNLKNAISLYEDTLKVRTRDSHPEYWAGFQYNLGNALADLAERQPEKQCKLLQRAIACGKASILVYTAESHPKEHADTVENLRIDRKNYESAGCDKETPFDDIKPAE